MRCFPGNKKKDNGRYSNVLDGGQKITWGDVRVFFCRDDLMAGYWVSFRMSAPPKAAKKVKGETSMRFRRLVSRKNGKKVHKCSS